MAFALRKPPPLFPKHQAYPYQLDAIRVLKDLSYAAVFHEQGLGKTKIAIDLILVWLEEDITDTVIVVTKKFLVQNWIEELRVHTSITPSILSGDRRANGTALNSPVLVYVTNYETISSNHDLFERFLGVCRVGAILDESQKIKNPDANLTKSFHSLSHKFARRIIMTGTPVANRPYDIWSQVKFLDGGQSLGNSFAKFKSNLNLPSDAEDNEIYGENLTHVMEKIRHFAIRETKQSSGLELPEKTIITRYVNLEPTQWEIYRAYRDELAYEFIDQGKLVVDDIEGVLKLLLRLVQCASNPGLLDEAFSETPGKFSELTDLLCEIDLRESKAIVWTGFVRNVEWLSRKLGVYFPQKVHGAMNINDRNNAIRQFKSKSQSRLLIATPGAAKEGLTLTNANHAIFFDRSFSLDDYLQAQDRIHRISQSRQCYVYNLIAKDTIDEWVDVLLNIKFQAARLTQGDISKTEFVENFNRDLTASLKDFLQQNF